MTQIEQLLQLLMQQAVKEKIGRGFIKVDNHQFGVTIEFQGYLEQPIDTEFTKSEQENKEEPPHAITENT